MDDKTQKRAKFLIDTAYFAVVAALVYLTVKYVAGWVLPFIVAFCIVTVIHPVIRRIEKQLKIKHEVASIIVMVLIYATVGLLIFLVIFGIIVLIREALTLLPGYYADTIRPAFDAVNLRLDGFIADLPPQWAQQMMSVQDAMLSALQSFLLGLSERGVSILSSMTSRVPASIIGLVFTIMLSFFLSMQYPKVLAFMKSVLPERAAHLASETRHVIGETVFKYMRAALTLMTITFTELTVGLLLLGHKNAVAIAAGIAVFDALPFFGTGAIVIPWALIELLQLNFTFAAGLLILYAVIAVVRQIIEPKIVGDRLGLNPIVSLVAIYLGFKLIGVIGMIFMPILTQILLALNKNGSIRLFKQRGTAETAEAGEAANTGDK